MAGVDAPATLNGSVASALLAQILTIGLGAGAGRILEQADPTAVAVPKLLPARPPQIVAMASEPRYMGGSDAPATLNGSVTSTLLAQILVIGLGGGSGRILAPAAPTVTAASKLLPAQPP